MKTLLKLLVVLTSICFAKSTIAQEKTYLININSFPTNLDSSNFKKIKGRRKQTIAFEGIIIDVQRSYNNTPYYKIRLDTKNFIWTLMMYQNDVTTIGNKVRVLGYLDRIDKSNEKESYVEGKYMIIGFGLVDFENKLYLFLKGADNQKNEWLHGKIPSAK
jgi:hypothetical protein